MKEWKKSLLVAMSLLLVIIIISVSQTGWYRYHIKGVSWYKLPLKQDNVKSLNPKSDVRVEEGMLVYKGELYTGLLKGRDLIVPVKNGVIDGMVEYYAVGERGNFRYKDGKVVGKARGVDPSTKKLIWDLDMKDGSGVLTRYFSDGSIDKIIPYEDYLPHGRSIYYYKDGSIKEDLNFEAGVIVGEHKTYYENGKKKYVGVYEAGELVEAIGWYGNGQVRLEKKDRIVKFYDYEGVMTRKNDLNEMKQYFYYDDGRVKEVKDYIKAKIIEGNISDSRLFYYNQLGLLVWARGRYGELDYDFDSATKTLSNIKANIGSSTYNYYRYNELGQPLHMNGEGYLIYGNSGLVEKKYYIGNDFRWEKEKITETGFSGKNRFTRINQIDEHDSSGRVIGEKGKYWDGIGLRINYKYDDLGNRLYRKVYLMGVEGEDYKYYEYGKLKEKLRYGMYGNQWKKSYEYDEKGREKRIYEQTYNIDKLEGDYEGKGRLILENNYVEEDGIIVKNHFWKDNIYLDMWDIDRLTEYKSKFKHDKKNRKVSEELRAYWHKEVDGKKVFDIETQPQFKYYQYYDSHEELVDGWNEIEEISDLLLKGIRRHDDILGY